MFAPYPVAHPRTCKDRATSGRVNPQGVRGFAAVHPGLLGGWGCQKPTVSKEDPDEAPRGEYAALRVRSREWAVGRLEAARVLSLCRFERILG